MKRAMLAIVALSALAPGSARAVPFSEMHSVAADQALNGGELPTSPRVQADLANPLLTDKGAQIASVQHGHALEFVNSDVPNGAGDAFRLAYAAANARPSVLVLDITPVPEPISLALLSIGLRDAGLMRCRSA